MPVGLLVLLLRASIFGWDSFFFTMMAIVTLAISKVMLAIGTYTNTASWLISQF